MDVSDGTVSNENDQGEKQLQMMAFVMSDYVCIDCILSSLAPKFNKTLRKKHHIVFKFLGLFFSLLFVFVSLIKTSSVLFYNGLLSLIIGTKRQPEMETLNLKVMYEFCNYDRSGSCQMKGMFVVF